VLDVTAGLDSANAVYALPWGGRSEPILVAGQAGAGALVARFRGDGTPDPAFGTGGHVVVDLSPGDDVARSVLPFGSGVLGALFSTLVPSRILDTCLGQGAPAARVGPASNLSVQVTGRGGVPATGVSAVVLNVTVTEPTAGSYLTAWPAGESRPRASNLNYAAGQTVPNLVTVKVGAGGAIDLYNNLGSAHVIADVAGWYGPA
ncbi:MAG: hypothetical protein ACRD1D_17455, partial [Acidimicrobiales bacterium]